MEIIDKVTNADTANAMTAEMAKIDHALTSSIELKAEWKKKIAELGLEWDKETKTYKVGGAS